MEQAELEAAFALALVSTGASLRSARPLQDGAGCHPFELLPAIHPALEARRFYVTGRRHRVPHPARKLDAGRGVDRLHLGVDVRRWIAAHCPGMLVPQK